MTPTPSLSERHTRHFFVAWAMATLFHQASFMYLVADPRRTLVSLAAAAVLIWPTRTLTFVALISLQVVEVWWRAPVVCNHWWTTGLVAMGLLIALIPARRGGFNVARWREEFQAPMRWCILVVYFYGVFHKLNSGFFDTELSCGVSLYSALVTQYLPFLPSGVGSAWFAIIGTLAVETAIPLLLIWRKTRAWGVLLGVSFHFFLGFVPYSVYYNFSSLLFAFFFLFTREDSVERAMERIPPLRVISEKRAWFVGAVLAYFAFAAWGGEHGQRALLRHLNRIPWAIYGGLCVAGAVAMVRGPETESEEDFPWLPRSRWLLGLPLLYLLNGASPYLGLKTETSLAMYSNLVTERGVANHFVIPGSLDPFERTEKVVVIKKSSSKALRRLKRKRQGMLWFEFRDYLARHPKTSVVFEIDGVRERVKRAGDDERFAKPEPWWIRKFVYFRPVDLDPRKRCSH
jgi:hypothetical protein